MSNVTKTNVPQLLIIKEQVGGIILWEDNQIGEYSPSTSGVSGFNGIAEIDLSTENLVENCEIDRATVRTIRAARQTIKLELQRLGFRVEGI